MLAVFPWQSTPFAECPVSLFKKMRVVKEIYRPQCKITVFQWNGKYLIKLEKGLLEQTFKVPELDITSEDELEAILSEEFMQKADERFTEMMQSLQKALREAL